MKEEIIMNWENLTETEKNQLMNSIKKVEEPKSKELMLLEQIAKDVSEIKEIVMMEAIRRKQEDEIEEMALKLNAVPQFEPKSKKQFWE